jgi:hypothetical protein
METNSESPSIPTTAPLLQFTPHAKHDSSKRPTPPKLELQVKHEAEEVPSFRASPSSSEPQPQKVAAHDSSLPRNAPPNRSCILATLARHISTSVRRHDSRLECGDGDNSYAYMRTSARALALIRAVGRNASFVPRAEKEHWLRWAQIDRDGIFCCCLVALTQERPTLLLLRLLLSWDVVLHSICFDSLCGRPSCNSLVTNCCYLQALAKQRRSASVVARLLHLHGSAHNRTKIRDHKGSKKVRLLCYTCPRLSIQLHHCSSGVGSQYTRVCEIKSGSLKPTTLLVFSQTPDPANCRMGFELVPPSAWARL